MDTFTQELRRIGMMLMYGQTVEEIHDVIQPEDEGRFYLMYVAAKRWVESSSVDVGSERL